MHKQRGKSSIESSVDEPPPLKWWKSDTELKKTVVQIDASLSKFDDHDAFLRVLDQRGITFTFSRYV